LLSVPDTPCKAGKMTDVDDIKVKKLSDAKQDVSLQLCKMTDEATKTIVDDLKWQVFMLLSRVLIA